MERVSGHDMEDGQTRSLLSYLDTAWSNIGSASIDVELPDVIAYADVGSQWDSFKHRLAVGFDAGRCYPSGVEIVDLPKDRLMVRPLARLEIEQRLLYEALVVAAAPSIKRVVSGSVYSNRWWARKQRFISPIGSWIKMQRAARRLHRRHPSRLLARTDISAFYEHVDVDFLVDDLKQLDIPEWVCNALEAFLVAFNGLSSAWGIPQGSDMSGMLANLYLTTFDAEIWRSGCQHFRYSDDTYIFGSDWTTIRQALVNVNRTLRHRHLNLSPSKTDICGSSDVLSRLEDQEKDAINYGLDVGAPGVVSEIRAIFDRAVAKDPVNTRDFKFSLTKLAKLNDAHAVSWIVGNFASVPHAAREALVYLNQFVESDASIKEAVVELITSTQLSIYPYAQQHLLIFMIRNAIRGRRLADVAWGILLNKNAETFVREMAARYLGLFGSIGESGRLKQEYQGEESHRVRRALLVACYESNQCGEKWLEVVATSDPALLTTAEYLQCKPSCIPRPAIERLPWR